jgi:2-polyprenyl-6-methoxyphenol hydroxylase-like FAD-dependent oxidoreductase
MSGARVLVVGGGPVGLALAIALGQRGIPCVVVERHQAPQPIPKGQNLTQRTMEHFHNWGIERELRAARSIPSSWGIGGLTAYGSLLSEYHYDWLQRELVRPYYFVDNERLPQYATEAVLRACAARLPALNLRFGWTAEGVSQDGAAVELVTREQATGARETLRADYIVGCDGSRSRVREQCGITQTCADHDRLMVLLVFRSPELHELLSRFPGKSFYSVLNPELGGYWQFFGRVDLGNTWFFHAPVPAGTTAHNCDFQALLHRAVGAPFAIELLHVGFWELRFAIADRYRAGRAFIAGDAAHSHPPYGGYGINTGFEDAVNLAWKLAASLTGWAGPNLLDSYSEERQPVFASTALDFIDASIRSDREFLARFDPRRDREAFARAWAERALGARGQVHAYAPNYEGSSIVWGPPGAVCSAIGSHTFTARAGHHLAPQPCSDGANLFTGLGRDFSLIALDAPSTQVAAFEAGARELGLPLKVVRDSFGGGRERLGARLVLVRPDQFVAWAGESDGEPTAVLRRAIGWGT